MPNPITPEMRAALAEVVDFAECGLMAWHDIGEQVCKSLPHLSALLTAAKDSLTVEATTDAAGHSEDARAMVAVEARRAMFEAWARGEGLETTRAPEGAGLSGEYLKPRTQLAWRAALSQWDGATSASSATCAATDLLYPAARARLDRVSLVTTKPPEIEMPTTPCTDAPRPRSKRLQQFAADHGLDSVTVRHLIVSGALVAHKVGRITIITEENERAWLASLPLAVPEPRARAAKVRDRASGLA